MQRRKISFPVVAIVALISVCGIPGPIISPLPTLSPLPTESPLPTPGPTDVGTAPTPQATETPFVTATGVTLDLTPSDEPLPPATATVEPTNTEEPEPTGTSAPRPTDTSVPVATSTAQPTSAPTPRPTITPTVEPVSPIGFVIDHTSVDLFDQIPEEYISAAASMSMVFLDKSVGENISSGLTCLEGTGPFSCSVAPPQPYYRGNWQYIWFNESGCADWAALVPCFVNQVSSLSGSYVVRMYGISYMEVDNVLATRYFWDTSSPSEIGDYISEASRNGGVVVHWTSSLAQNSDQDAKNFNEALRIYRNQNGGILFDLADIESHGSNGRECTLNGYPIVCNPEYTTQSGNGGHLHKEGQKYMARALWVLMARIAGWVPDEQEPTPAPATSTPVVPPTHTATPQNTPTLTSTPGATASPTITPAPSGSEWSTVAGGIERHSWTSHTSAGTLPVQWYRVISAYVPSNFQPIVGNGLVYVASSAGLYAFDITSGDLVWRFDTSMPLGNSPAISGPVAYIGGYDMAVRALGPSGAQIWAFYGASAGYSASPMVVGGVVYAASRDGCMYALDASSGSLLWKSCVEDPILMTPAYGNGKIYFAAGEYGYAMSDGGEIVWRSKLNGDASRAYWPVVYGDMVIFTTAAAYRPGPVGIESTGSQKIFDLERDEVFGSASDGAKLPAAPPPDYTRGYTSASAVQILEYHEAKPWRVTMQAFNTADGSEYSFDYDADGKRNFIPALYWGTYSGQAYPPIVGLDGLLYFGTIYQKFTIPQGKVVAWRPGDSRFVYLRGQGAIDEPIAISMGGDKVYRVICCDRVGDWFRTSTGSLSNGVLWDYSNPLYAKAPGYDSSWWGVVDPVDRLYGSYGGVNGIYHLSGSQSPIVPYNGMLFTIKSGAIVAFGSGVKLGRLPDIVPVSSNEYIPERSKTGIVEELESQVDKLIDAGLVGAAYFNGGQMQYSQFADYFSNPGDTLIALTEAYPYLSQDTQERVVGYLDLLYTEYFSPTSYSHIGWQNNRGYGTPPEVASDMASIGPSTSVGPRWPWSYHQNNLYALWKYAQLAPEKKSEILGLAKRLVELPSSWDTSRFDRWPWEMQGYIAGYTGLLGLMDMVGDQDQPLRNSLTERVDYLVEQRSARFSATTYYTKSDGTSYQWRVFNVARNWLMMTPELGQRLRQSVGGEMVEAFEDFTRVAPYWFVSRFNGAGNESATETLYDREAMYLAMRYALGDRCSDIVKYIDVPSFNTGDLSFIRILAAAASCN